MASETEKRMETEEPGSFPKTVNCLLSTYTAKNRKVVNNT